MLAQGCAYAIGGSRLCCCSANSARDAAAALILASAPATSACTPLLVHASVSRSPASRYGSSLCACIERREASSTRGPDPLELPASERFEVRPASRDRAKEQKYHTVCSQSARSGSTASREPLPSPRRRAPKLPGATCTVKFVHATRRAGR